MGLGDILGSISPGFGLISGKGLGSYLKYLSPAYDIFALAGHHGHQSPVDVASTPSSVGVAGQQPLSQIGGVPSMASASASLPGMSGQSHNPLAMIGSSMMNAPHDNQQVQVQQAYAPQLQPMDMSALQQLLGSIGMRHY